MNILAAVLTQDHICYLQRSHKFGCGMPKIELFVVLGISNDNAVWIIEEIELTVAHVL